jgi:hypothetical protein
VDWIPCTRPSVCTNRLPPDSRIPIGYANLWWVKSFRRYTSVTVFWWKLLKNPDGTYRVDHMRSFAADIP